MLTDRAAAETMAEPAFPSTLEHQHGLKEWWPMLPERSAEPAEPGRVPTERFYRCQKVGCSEVVRVRADAVGG